MIVIICLSSKEKNDVLLDTELVYMLVDSGNHVLICNKHCRGGLLHMSRYVKTTSIVEGMRQSLGKAME